MSKKILFLVLLAVLLLPPSTSLALQTYGSAPSLRSIVHGAEMAAGLIFGCIAVICFVMAGVLFLTAQGEPEKLTQARAAFFWGIAGVIIGIIAFSIIAIVGRIIS